jgi:CubicO group peptidase (beta-lactamase class C family)
LFLSLDGDKIAPLKKQLKTGAFMKIISFFLVFAAHCYAGVFDWLDSSSPKAKRISEFMQELEPMIDKALKDYQVPGLSIGIVSEGKLVYAKGLGWRDVENQLPATAETVYSIGSCSKAFTSFLAGTLVDEGLISWDQRIVDIYPEFRLWDSHATLNLTMRDLLTHRSGMPQHDLMWYNSSTLTRSEVMRRLRYLQPSCDIRERYQYNNLMYLAAGFSMEYLMARSWEDLVAERILNPLGMSHTSFRVADMLKKADFAAPHVEKKDNALKRMAFRDISLIGPAGGINSNVIDLAKWVEVHLGGGRFEGKSIISPAVLQEMHAPQMIVPGTPECNESPILTTGLGWNMVSYRGHYYVSHDGALDGFTSVIGFLPREDLGIIVLSNKNLSILPRFLSLQIIDGLLNLPFIDWLQDGLDTFNKTRSAKAESMKKEDLSRKKETQPSHPIQKYAGEYFHEGYGTLLITEKDGKLSIFMNDLECLLEHWHYDVFVISEEAQDMFRTREGARLSFQNGSNGEIEKLVVPFEPKSGDVVFTKRASGSLSAHTYLKQFTGVYEIYGYVVEIVLNKGVLSALVPGLPSYELVPESKNEFSVKALAGYTVRFVMDQEQKVEEVLLIQPYGAFSATPKR